MSYTTNRSEAALVARFLAALVVTPLLAVLAGSVSAMILVEGVNDGPPPCCLMNANGEAQVSVYPDATIDYNEPRYLNFDLTAGQRLGDTELSILIELPDGKWMGDPHFKLTRGDRTLNAENYIRPHHEDPAALILTVPAFEKGEIVRLSLGWYAAELEKYGASFNVGAATVSRSLIGTWQGPQFKYMRKRSTPR